MSVAGKRRNAAIIGGAILLLVALVAMPAYSIWRAQNNANVAASNAAARVQRQCAGLSGRALAQCAYQVVDAARQRQRDEYNLEAQRKLANGGNWLIIIGGIEIFLTGTGLRIIYGQLHATRIGFQTENRAWVEILSDFSKGDLTYNDGAFTIETNFTFKNIGKTVALNVGFHIQLIPDPSFDHARGEPEVAEFERQLITHSRQVDTYQIFPGRELPREWSVTRAAGDFAVSKEGLGANSFLPALCIGVRYNTIFDAEGDPPHITMEVASIRRIEGGLPAYALTRDSLPKTKVAFIRSMINMSEVT
jgi:hypothetical protein